MKILISPNTCHALPAATRLAIVTSASPPPVTILCEHAITYCSYYSVKYIIA